ncbi:MAG TPA: peptidylprolyl isomerase [Phnomibacter sp.]|nr:peptidylprolyl isomerase [Phnomibacter sp.]
MLKKKGTGRLPGIPTTFDILLNKHMDRMQIFRGSLSLLIIGMTMTAFGQTKKMVADKIVGKVGDRIVLKSDVTNAIADIERQGGELPPDPECVIFESELIKKALVLQAEKDSIDVDEEEIESLIDNQIRGFVQMYGGIQALEEISGRTVYQLKDDFKIPFKERQLANKMRNKILESVKISPVEVKAYWEEIPKDSLPYYESELEVGQIVVYPKPNRDIESYTAKQLNDIKKQIESGSRRFDQMARLYSEDPGSKNTGGQYTLNRNDKFWDPVFLNTAFKLREGQISNVVKSKFGLHIIQCVSRSGDDAVVRHILMVPPITDDEINEAKDKLDSVRAKMIAGTLTFGEAVAKYSDEEDKFTGGWIMGGDGGTLITIDQLDKELLPLLKDLKAGQYSMPTPFTTEQGKKGVRVLYLRTRTDPHVENMQDDYNKIATRALEEKKNRILERWFEDKVQNYYIFVDADYNNCTDIKTWIEASNRYLGKN